jgi:hypothetical protein
MARIKLTVRECELLKICFGENKIKFVDNLVVEVEKKQIEFIIDTINALFIKKGLKKNNEPNKIGFELEELNDKFIFALQQFDLKK